MVHMTPARNGLEPKGLLDGALLFRDLRSLDKMGPVRDEREMKVR